MGKQRRQKVSDASESTNLDFHISNAICDTCPYKNQVTSVCLNEACGKQKIFKAICPSCHYSLEHSSAFLEKYISLSKEMLVKSLEITQNDRQKLLYLQESLNQVTFMIENMKQRTYNKLQEHENQKLSLTHSLNTFCELEREKNPTSTLIKEKIASASSIFTLNSNKNEENPMKINLNFYSEFVDSCEMEIWVKFANYFSIAKRDWNVKIEEESEKGPQSEIIFYGTNEKNSEEQKINAFMPILLPQGEEDEEESSMTSSDIEDQTDEEEDKNDEEDKDSKDDGDYGRRPSRRRVRGRNTRNRNQNRARQSRNPPNRCNNKQQESETLSQSNESEGISKKSPGGIRKIRELSQREKTTLLKEFDKTNDIKGMSKKFNIKYRRLYNFIQNQRGPNTQSIRQYSDEEKQQIYNDYIDTNNVREVANKWKLNYDSLYSFIRYKKQK